MSRSWIFRFVYLSLAFPDFLGHHNTNRFEENNTRESPFHGARSGQKIQISRNRGRGFVWALRYQRNFCHISRQSLFSGTSCLLRAHYILKFPPYHTSLPSSSPSHVAALTSAKDRVSEQLRKRLNEKSKIKKERNTTNV